VITLLLGNHDRKAEVMEQYGVTTFESLTWGDEVLGKISACHDPEKFPEWVVNGVDVLLHAHLHTGTHRSPHSAFGPKAHCLSIEVLPHTPEPISYEELVEMVRARRG
jgi:calcineurin-like phosphoesterase family protein